MTQKPKPVTIRIDGIQDSDIQFWARLFMRGADIKGYVVGPTSGIPDKFVQFTICPKE